MFAEDKNSNFFYKNKKEKNREKKKRKVEEQFLLYKLRKRIKACICIEKNYTSIIFSDAVF